jgi:Peptidase family M23
VLVLVAAALLVWSPSVASAAVSDGFDFPLGSGNDPNNPRVTQGWCVIDHASQPHLGIDWGAPSGTPAFAVSKGWVHRRGWVSGYGNAIQLRHVLPDGSTWYSWYGHLRDPALPGVGTEVGRRQHIGYVGATGNVTGPHLHFAISSSGGITPGYGACGSGGTVDPIAFINTRRNLGAISEGSFVRAPDGKVYRIAGGAPIYVSSWDSFGGGQPVTDVSFERLNAMRPWPADGTFIHTNQNGAVYRIAGGAPIYVSTWSAYGGPQPTVGIDKWAVDNITHPAAHMRAVPENGTFVHTQQNGAVYRIAGGAPIYVSTWSAYGGPQPTVGIDKWAVDNITHPAAHMRRHPADGTFLHTTQDGRVYRVAGAAPLYVTSWDIFGGPRPYVDVDRWAVANAGHPASHLLRLPLDGTLIRGLPSRSVWRIVGGKREPTSEQSGFVDINDATALSFPPVDTADETDHGSSLDVAPPVDGAAPPTFGTKTLVRLNLGDQQIRARGPVAVRISNANGFIVTGRLSCKTAEKIPVVSRKRTRRIKLKSRVFTVDAGANKTVRLKLPSRLGRILEQRRDLPLRLTARVWDPAGNVRTVKRRVSAKLRASRRRPGRFGPRVAGHEKRVG